MDVYSASDMASMPVSASPIFIITVSLNDFPLDTSMFLDLAKMGMKQIESDTRN